MGTKILLPHALVAIPTRPLPAARLGFQSSTIALRPGRLALHPLTVAAPRRSFSARAEGEPDAGGAEVDEGGGEGEGAVTLLEKGEVEEVTEARKQRVKLGDVMGILNKKAVGAVDEARPIPDVRVGDVLRIKLGVPRRRRKFAFYRGIVISRQNAGIHTTIRVRRIIQGVGVEIVFPLYSPLVQEITVVSHRKVRRAKLYYLRDKLPRFSTFKKI